MGNDWFGYTLDEGDGRNTLLVGWSWIEVWKCSDLLNSSMGEEDVVEDL